MTLSVGGRPDIALVISDVDGTLVTPDKILTPAAIAAVRGLRDAGVGFTLISSRPPRGMASLVTQLDVCLPFSAFNGGSLSGPDLGLLETHRLAPEVAREIIALLAKRGVDVWVFALGDWLLRDPDGTNVPREKHTVGFDPKAVDDFENVIDCIDKIVGVSNDVTLLAAVESELKATMNGTAAIILSQPFYLDVTHPRANKGDGVSALCDHIGVDLSHTAVIGDMFNDVAMFARAGYSIAMGQSPDDVKKRADAVAKSNTEDGFAYAVNRLIL